MSYGSWNVYCPCESFSLNLLGSMKTAPNIGIAGRLRRLGIGPCSDRIQKAIKSRSDLLSICSFWKIPGPVGQVSWTIMRVALLRSCFATVRFRSFSNAVHIASLDAPPFVRQINQFCIILPIFASLLPRVFAKHHYATMQLHAIRVWMFYKLASFSTSVKTKSANKASQPQL